MRREFTPLGLMQLVIAFDKHAVFAEVAESRTKEDAGKAWDLYQRFLRGEDVKFLDVDNSFDEEDGDEGDQEFGVFTGQEAGVLREDVESLRASASGLGEDK